MTRATAIVARVVLLPALAGCTVGPDYAPPEIPLPEAHASELGPGLKAGAADLEEWWTKLGDPGLSALVERAAERNLDLREAMARIREARARRGLAGADGFPTLDAVGSYSRTQVSRETPLGGFGPRSYELFAAGFDAAWELDLWGRVRRAVEAGEAELDAAFEDARDVLVTVLAETALNYVELRSLQARVAIARSNLALQEATVGLAEARFEAGLVSDLDVAQARTNLEDTRSAIPPLEIGVRAAKNRLALLLGLAPGAVDAQLEAPDAIPVASVELAVGVPADILRQRADVRRAERELAAQTARIGVATAELYPRLTLLGNIGLESADISDLATGGATAFSFGPSVSWRAFDGGRIRRAIEIEDARAEQALRRYERVVLEALEEVENAMTAFVREQVRREALEAAVRESRRAVELSETQYRDGLVDFQSVLDSQRALFALEDDLAQNRSAITSQLVVLYKALGGGWEGELPPVAESAGT